MFKLLLLTLLSTLLFSQHPKVYAALGDVIYDNVDKIDALKDLAAYSNYEEDISTYVNDVKALKKIGFKIESMQAGVDKKEYLNGLRELSKKNDFYTRSAKIYYKKSLENEDTQLFSKLINSGLIDTQKNKQEIIEFYFAHEPDINASGVIQGYLDEDAKLKARRDAQAASYKTKKMREAEKIKRVRKNDLEAQKKLEKRLEEEVRKKKLEIRERQKMELEG